MKKKPKKEPSAVKASSSRKKTEDDDGKKKKQEKKKGSKWPKKSNYCLHVLLFNRKRGLNRLNIHDCIIKVIHDHPLNSILFNSWMQNVKKSNPGIQFKDIGRVLGERWNKMTGIHQFHFPFLDCISSYSPLSICISAYINKPLPLSCLQRRRRPHMKQKLEQTRNGTVKRLVAIRIHSQWLLTPLMNQTVLRTFHCCRKTIGGSDYSQSRRLEFLESIEVCFLQNFMVNEMLTADCLYRVLPN